MKPVKNILLLFALFIVISCSNTHRIAPRLDKAVKQLSLLRQTALKEGKNPRSADKNGNILWTLSPYDWTEGFWPGTCWMLFEWTNEVAWKQAAIATQKLFIDHRDLKTDHDIGFIFNNSYGKAFKLTGDSTYKRVLIDAANSLISRFNPAVGCIQSWDLSNNWQSQRGWQFPVIIDNMMNLELLFEVAEITKDNKYSKIAITHANTTMHNHFRPDGSSYHVVDYNPQTGEVLHRVTAQGYSDESSWARGQAWGLYAYTMCYRYTKDRKYLEFAEKIASFILNHPNYPKDGIPYWDFNAPNIPNEKRDASAASILASGLLELSDYTNGKYLKDAVHILNTLATDQYTAKTGTNGGFVLMHSVGSIPHGAEIDVPLNYADYYYLEALMRLKKHDL